MQKKRSAAETVLKVRASAELRAKLEGAAKRNHASLNAEMAGRLGRSFEHAEIVSGAYAVAYGEAIAVALPKIADGLRTVASANELRDAGKIDKATHDSIVRVGLKQADEAFAAIRGKVNAR